LAARVGGDRAARDEQQQDIRLELTGEISALDNRQRIFLDPHRISTPRCDAGGENRRR
jgi:hypothetical protein